MTTTPHLGITEMTSGQSDKEVTFNEAVRYLEAVVQGNVIDKDLTAPPGGESDGDRYIVGGSATGDWSGQDDKIAYYKSSSWIFLTPVEGWKVWVQDENKTYYYTGAAWAELSGSTDTNAIHDNVASEISALSEKASPVSADLLIIEDSEDSNNKKKVQAGNLPGGGSWDGDIADIDLDGGSDIGAALADADLILVDDGAGGTNRKSAISRVWTYIQTKLQAVTSLSGYSFFIDEDNMASDLDTKVPSQQSVKAYADTKAPAANGVTNGDSHDHSGGDGAQIDHTTLSNIGTNTHAQIDTHLASTSNPHSTEGAALLSTGETNGTKFLREDGDGTCSWQSVPGGGWDGDIADIDLDGGSDIGAALADADLILVDDGAGGTNRKSAISRVWTYIQTKLQAVTSLVGYGFFIDEDNMASDLDTKVPSQQSVKAYADTKAPIASPSFTGTVTLPTGLTGVLRADSGVVSTDGDVTDLVGAASDSAAGKVELATTAETNTGTDTGRAVTPDGLAGSVHGQKSWCMPVFDSDTDVATGDGKFMFLVPAQLTGMDIVAAVAGVHTQGVTGTTDVQLRRRRAGSDADMLSTKITIGAEYYAADGVINTSNDDLQTGDMIYVDVDAVHSGTAPKGLSVTITAGLP